MTAPLRLCTSLALVVSTASVARAQPAPGPTPTPVPIAEPVPPPPPDPQRPPDPAPVRTERPLEAYPAAPPDVAAPPAPKVDDPPLDPTHAVMPGLVFAPTAMLLPAGVISGSFGVDTIGAIESDLRVGLGGVAEFGLGTNDLIRSRACVECAAELVRAVPTARFAMGLDEDRLFRYQPAVVLGYQKSFRRDHDERSSRFAKLYLVASRRLGIATFHLGGTLWDANVTRDDGTEVILHDAPLASTIRPFGGIELAARPKAKIMVEVSWNPELRYSEVADQVVLRPMLAFGVRTGGGPIAVEAGVRVPDIGEADLLDAQIFAQVRFVTWKLARAISRTAR